MNEDNIEDNFTVRVYCPDCGCEYTVSTIYLSEQSFLTHCIFCGSESIDIDDTETEEE